MNAVLKLPEMTYAREPIAGLWDELKPLTQAHWQEIAWFKDDIPLSPDFAGYEKLESLNALRLFTARANAELIGYACYVLSRPLHYDILQAFCDVVFVHEDYRRGRAGLTLLDYAEGQCIADGAQLICYHGKVNTPGFEHLMKARKFEPMDTIYVRRV